MSLSLKSGFLKEARGLFLSHDESNNNLQYKQSLLEDVL